MAKISITLIYVEVPVGWYIYHRRDKKEANERFEFILDIIKKQNQLTSEAADELKEVSDALFIPKDKLIFNYKEPLGTGICSTVYRGFLYGPSPLMKLTGLIETQDFQDCDVAVKVALHFGDDEVDQLFREIEAMKILQYNRNVISMLGWRMLNGKPALVCELAEQDLLRYAKLLMSINIKEIPFKTIISILWQIAKGMEFISSKDIVHRDLAARNVLLTHDFQAKISDFGLAVINNSGIKESSVAKKLPIRWLSIEAIVEKLFSEKSDVWAFGVLMYEVFSMGQDPYAGIPTDGILRFLRCGERMNRPSAKYGFDTRTRIAILDHNNLIEAENNGTRVVIGHKKVWSRAKGDFVQKKIKNDVHAKWKDEIIALDVERKLNNMDVDLSEAEDEGDLELENDADNLINQVNDLQIDDLDELIYDLNISYEDEEQAMEQ
uniref:Protein kinase domain-containing protein n=1 Tax=Acrobeloides nanus TaxID=290746 RepID=A0A914EDQ3_9BILA